jgi:lipoic acid synthetase
VVDADEPEHVAKAIRDMDLRHAVITAVTRDDLADGGAAHIAAVVRAVHRATPETTIEVLTPDFQGEAESVRTVIESGPEVFSHNIETVRRLHGMLRGRRVSYETALDVLREAARCEPRPIVKSAFMVGHGETGEEVRETLSDLRDAGCDAVNIGQYLRPTSKQREVVEFVPPQRFAEYERWSVELGFRFAVAGPFVRSSYRSDEMMEQPFARERVRALRRARL